MAGESAKDAAAAFHSSWVSFNEGKAVVVVVVSAALVSFQEAQDGDCDAVLWNKDRLVEGGLGSMIVVVDFFPVPNHRFRRADGCLETAVVSS